tara:strand:- start:64 stop:333 length:270 start_codon:yes stop_codon:yes gene_type:complete
MNDEKVSHNIVTGIDDMEYVEMFNLDPALAYTPQINEAILNSVYDNNLAGAIAEGVPEAEARADANKQRESGRLTVAAAIKEKNNPQVP